MLQRLKQNIYSNLKNIPGWRTHRKIVIIECDDWGGIRMPSKYIYEKLIKKGLKVNTGWHNMYDTLENNKDLEHLFEVISTIKDKNKHPAVITAVTNVANPDFKKIKSFGFTEYYYEPFTATLNRYYPNKNVFKLWQEGITASIFSPELHGREHLSVQLWMQKLREGNKDLLFAFDHEFTSLDIPGVPIPAKEFRAEFFFTSQDQKAFLIKSIIDGISLFRVIFGRLPKVFVPGNGIFHPDFEKVLGSNGIKFLYVNHSSHYPIEGGKLKGRYLFTGQNGPGNITYYTRNCAFEPIDRHYKGIELTLKQINAAFRWGKPANISTHRANYSGGIDKKNREAGLKELKKLLMAIVKKWPDVEFMNSGDALEYMKKYNN